MFHRILLITALASISVGTALAGEAAPGLEIFNSDGSVEVHGPNGSYVQPGPSAAPQTPVYADSMTQPYGSPAAAAQNSGQLIGEPYADPNAPAPYPADAGVATTYAEPAPVPPVDPFLAYVNPEAVLATLDVNNPQYPGLDAAVVSNNFPSACDIILRTLRQRRIVNAALAKGPGGSLGTVAPHEIAFLSQMLTEASVNPGPPLNAVRRVDAILDTFEQPILDDVNYNSLMQPIMLRLYADMNGIMTVLADPPEDVVYHELARAYLRIVAVCDFFKIDTRTLINDVNAVMASADTMFYPDGTSVGGDVGGVSANPFHDLIMLDQFSYGNDWFRRNIRSGWRVLEKPAQALQGMMLPDMTLPRFGPRAEHELTPVDMAKLKKIFPQNEPLRTGLAASSGYPRRSSVDSYGGLFVSRSGPEAGARYLAVRFGPWGQLPGAPAHNDFGSLVVAQRSVKFIDDAGGFGGGAAEGASHNVLSLDGMYTEPTSYNTPMEPVDSIWRTNAAIDFASDAVAFPDGKRWQRDVLYVKPLPGEGGSDFWLLLDHVEMNNDNTPRQARIRFQLAPGVQAYHEGAGMLLTPNYGMGSALRIFAIDANSQLTMAEGDMGIMPSFAYTPAGSAIPAQSVVLERTLVGDSTTASLLYPGENSSFSPVRIERDADIIRGRTGAIVVDHGQDKIDVIAWSPPGGELVTPTLNLQLDADAAVFRLRKGKIVRAAFVNLRRFQAKEPDGGDWSMRVRGGPATIYLEPEAGGGWQVLSDAANPRGVWLEDVNLGPGIGNRRMRIDPNEVRVFVR